MVASTRFAGYYNNTKARRTNFSLWDKFMSSMYLIVSSTFFLKIIFELLFVPSTANVTLFADKTSCLLASPKLSSLNTRETDVFKRSLTNTAAFCFSVQLCLVTLSLSSNGDNEWTMTICLRRAPWSRRYDHGYWWANVTRLKRRKKRRSAARNRKQTCLIFAGSNQPPHSHPLCPHMCEIKAIAGSHLTGKRYFSW